MLQTKRHNLNGGSYISYSAKNLASCRLDYSRTKLCQPEKLTSPLFGIAMAVIIFQL